MNTQTIENAVRYGYAMLQALPSAAVTSPQALSFYRTTAIVVDDTITTTTQLLTDTAIALHTAATSPTAIRFYKWTGQRAVDDTTKLIETAVDVVSTVVLVSQFLLTFLARQDHEEVEEYQTALPYAPTPKALPPASGPIALLSPAKDTETKELPERATQQQQPWLSLWPKPGTKPTIGHCFRTIPDRTPTTAATLDDAPSIAR